VTEELADGTGSSVQASAPLLASFSVDDLFGRYSYDVDVPTQADGLPGRLLLIYGDNGSGKTTLLNMVRHLLSPAHNRQHRRYLMRVPFSKFTVRFSDGSSIVVVKTSGLLGSFDVTVSRPAEDRDFVVRFEANDTAHRAELDLRYRMDIEFRARHAGEPVDRAYERALRRRAMSLDEDVVKNQEAEEEFYKFLRESEINPLFLADDRTIYSDDYERERERDRERRAPSDAGQRSATEVVERELRETISRVNDVVTSLTLAGQNIGSAGANTIYGNVLRHLATTSGDGDELHSATEGEAGQLLQDLEKQSPRFEEFGLVPHFAADEFFSLMQAIPQERQGIAEGILVPYLDSLRTRYVALEDAERILRALLTTINDFLVDKSFTFTPRLALRILTASGGDLEVSSLSSGERQLTMLLCTTLLAGRGSRLFIIDEPELSLGVRWQRQILDALLTLTDGSPLQFIAATHSVEMITSQSEYLVRLKRRENA